MYLWQIRDAASPSDGGSWLVQRYGGRRASRSSGAVVTLTSINKAYPSMLLRDDGATSLTAVADFVESLG